MPSKMEFDCKLAHLDTTKKLSNFNSQRELFERICQSFYIPLEEILYCTVNTHNFRDTDSLLGNFLSSGDLIVVHLCGRSRDISIKKTQECLGLTITDNGLGRAFVKKVSSEDPKILEFIKPGDHIAAINSESMINLRHYEVAKAIRSISLNATFTFKMIEPEYDSNFQKDSTTNSTKSTGNYRCHPASPYSLDLSSSDDLIHSSLPMNRLLSKSSFEEQENSVTNSSASDDSLYRATIDKINSALESFLGINDNLLAIKIYRLAHENQDSFSHFSDALKESELSIFNFDHDLQDHLWHCAATLSTSASSIQ